MGEGQPQVIFGSAYNPTIATSSAVFLRFGASHRVTCPTKCPDPSPRRFFDAFHSLARIFKLAVPMNITTRALIRIGKPAYFLTTVFAVVGAVFLFPRWSNANAPGYKLAVLERGPIVSTVAATGTINPITTVIVGSQLSGQVVGILADYNDKVTAGQILARLNSDQIRFKRDAAKADLEQARATQVMQEARMAEAELTFPVRCDSSRRVRYPMPAMMQLARRPLSRKRSFKLTQPKSRRWRQFSARSR